MSEKTESIAGSTDDTPGEMGAMPLTDHLRELRNRLIYSLIVVAVLFIVALPNAPAIINFLKRPLQQALPDYSATLHFTGPMDVFIATIKVSILSAIVCSCPFWIYHLWRFIEPALYPKERKFVIPFAVASILLFVAGISFCFFLILPLALEWLMGLGQQVGTPIITVKDYLTVVFTMLLGFGVIFEAPVILVLLGLVGLYNAQTLASHRRMVIVGVFIVAAIVTPTPDPITQTSMAVPLYLMYEMSIVILRVIQGKNPNSGTHN